MRKITLVCVGNLKERYWVEAICEYKKRLSKFFDFKIIEIDEKRLLKVGPAEIEQVKEYEGEQIIKQLKGKIICPLVIEGEQMSSEKFAEFVSQKTDQGELCFVIGGSYGLADKIKSLGKGLSFGKMTFPHQMMRVVFVEQLYRAGTIINNIEYHK